MTAVLVTGTATEVGKTWIAVRLVAELRARGVTVRARKPAQSFSPAELGATDAELLAHATGESPESVCPPDRWYPEPMAPPMAAAILGRPSFTIADLVRTTDVGRGTLTLVEGAGGPLSPLAGDGHVVDLARALGIGLAVLVADAGLGAVNAVRVSVAALAGFETLVVLNRYDPADALHRANRDQLRIDGFVALTDVAELAKRLMMRVPSP
jgi:dethiobiotin synthase